MQNTIFDMETADPDDLLTLCFLSHNPKVNLVAVTVTPGTPEQIGLVKVVLKLLGRDIPVGSRNINHAPDGQNLPKKYVSEFYYKCFGNLSQLPTQFWANPDGTGPEILAKSFRDFPDATLITGAPLHNLRLLLEQHPDVLIHRWVAQVDLLVIL